MSIGDSVWEHPCDEYYRKLFKEEKLKKERQPATSPKEDPKPKKKKKSKPKETISKISIFPLLDQQL
jgi:hypothetical protein